MLNEYEQQKQKEFDTLYKEELDIIDDKITDTLTDIIGNIIHPEDFTKKLFKNGENYRFKVNDREINIDCEDDMYIIDMSNNDLSKYNAFHIYDNGSINYEHHDPNNDVFWNDDIGNFETNEEKLNYFKEKIDFLEWLKENGTELIKLIIQAIDYNEENSPILKDIKELEKLAKNYN